LAWARTASIWANSASRCDPAGRAAAICARAASNAALAWARVICSCAVQTLVDTVVLVELLVVAMVLEVLELDELLDELLEDVEAIVELELELEVEATAVTPHVDWPMIRLPTAVGPRSR
jgi:hypothetical protein